MRAYLCNKETWTQIPGTPIKDPLSASLTPVLGVWGGGGEAEGLCSSVSTSLVGNSKENKAEEL